MKKIFYLLYIALAFVGCNDDDDKLPRVTPEATGTFTDMDGQVYKWVRYNGIDWMTSNYKGGEPYYNATDRWGDDLIDIDNKELAIADLEIYGNLYTYEQAQEHVPDGWRLPTDEDWQKLEQAMGMSDKTADKKGWRGSGVGELLQQDETGSGMNLLLGGYVAVQAIRPMNLHLRLVRVYGYYWTSTEDNDSYPEGTAVYYRSIRYNSSRIEREIMATHEQDYQNNVYPKYLSVRYVRDAQ